MRKVNNKQLCGWLDLTHGRVHQLTKKGVLERDDDQKYDLQQSVLNYIEHLRAHSVEHVNLNMSAAEAKQRKLIAEATLAEIEMNLKKGIFIEVNDILPELERMMTAFKTKMLAIPSKIAPVLYEKDIAQMSDIIKEQMLLAFNELAIEKIEINPVGEDDEALEEDASCPADDEN